MLGGQPLAAVVSDPLMVPRVLVTCKSQQLEVEGDENKNVPLYYYITDNIKIQFGRVTGLKFGVENLAESNDCVFQLVLLGVEGKRRILDWMLRYPRVVAWKKGKFMGTMVHGFFHGNMRAARLTPNETEARSDWWISSRAYFVCEDMNVELARQANKGPIIVSQHYGISDLSKFPSMQTHPNSNSLFNIGMPTNWQTPMPSQPGSSNWQRQMPAHSATPFWQPAIPSHPGTYNYKIPIPSHMGNPNLQPPIGRHHDVVGLFDQIRTFLNYLRPVLMIDAAHLKGLYKGTNLVAVTMDGNNQIVPIAFGIYKGETGPCWSWWISSLKGIGDNPNLLFIYDRHAAIDLVVENKFLLAFHTPDAYKKLCKAGPQRWSRGHSY
nr:transposase, MuDR, MULE transposase domain protein [Tanacetum cinerariifolium]